jgi:hypothetical protein
MSLVGPEIVLVDIDSYKDYSNNKKEMNILVNACHYEYTMLETKKLIINVYWKGYLYIATFEHLPYNIRML